MSEANYVLVRDGVVQQLLSTEQEISKMFAPGMQWIKVATPDGVAPGDLYDGTKFTAAAPPSSSVPRVTLFDLQAELERLRKLVDMFAAEY